MTTASLPQTDFRLSFKSAFGQIDQEKGKLSDVSLMTEGEALGHGCWCDTKTLQSVFALAQKSPVKAYLTHGSFFKPDRLGDEVGLFSGLYIEGNQLKAKQFSFFKSFRDGEKKKYEAIMELASADASLFGVSLSFSGKLVWVMADGSELSADSDEMPAGAVRDMPSVRVERIYSADFVSDPAANPNGLFDARLQAAAKLLGIPVQTLSTSAATVSATVTVDASTQNETKTNFTMIKDLRTKFSDPVKFARACELLSENEKLTIPEIEAKLNVEADVAKVKQLEEAVAKHADELKARDEKIKQLEEAVKAAGKGANPINLGTGEGAGDANAKVFEEWAKLSGKEATLFWDKNQKAILAYKAGLKAVPTA
jgi:hypothetical protein